MKDKPIAIIITLLGGSVACIMCLIRQVSLLPMLVTVFASLFVFMLIGMVVNKRFVEIKAEVEQRLKEEAEEQKLREEEELQAKEEAENQESEQEAASDENEAN